MVGAGDTIEPTDTLSNVAVAILELPPLVTNMPMNTLFAIEIVSLAPT
jgi:hypothetical protein